MPATTCPACQTILTGSEASSGDCPFCHTALPVIVPEKNRHDPVTPVTCPMVAKVAVGLLFGSLAAGVLRAVADTGVLRAPAGVSSGFVWVVFLGTLGILTLLFSLIATGRRWAFVVTLVLTVLGLPGTVMALSTLYRNDFGAFSISLMQLVMQLTAFVLLLTGPARVWFRAKRVQRLSDAIAYSH